jgi:hypothetical protein
LSAAVRPVPRKRRRMGPAPEAQLGRQIVLDQPRAVTPAAAVPGFFARLVSAVKPESDADATLMVGLVLLGVSIGGIFGSVFAGLLPAGIVLTFVALLAYLRPRGDE